MAKKNTSTKAAAAEASPAAAAAKTTTEGVGDTSAAAAIDSQAAGSTEAAPGGGEQLMPMGSPELATAGDAEHQANLQRAEADAQQLAGEQAVADARVPETVVAVAGDRTPPPDVWAYEVVSPLDHDQVAYAVGDTVHLSAKQAVPLLGHTVKPKH